MNFLYTCDFPESIILYGKSVRVRCDFKSIIEIAAMLFDCSVPVYIRPIMALRMFFYDSLEEIFERCGDGIELTELINKSIEAMSCFLSGGDGSAGNLKVKRSSDLTLPYDFNKDADLIYAAFMQTYGIDLAEKNMHWLRFRALFKGLARDTEFLRVVGIRTIDVSAVSDPKKRAELRRLKAKYSLKSNLSSEDKAYIVGQTLQF